MVLTVLIFAGNVSPLLLLGIKKDEVAYFACDLVCLKYFFPLYVFAFICFCVYFSVLAIIMYLPESSHASRNW